MTLTFDRSLDVPHGVEMRLSPRVSRLLAPNPGPFTFRGTGVYILGAGREVALIDPGPALPGHLEALKRALAGRTVSQILVTHTHSDHSPAARPLADWSGAKIYAHGPGAAHEDAGEEGGDRDFVPDIEVRDGHMILGADYTLSCVFTPGHTSGHMCYALEEEKALFTGDHVMGWSTSVIAPPDGDMALYMAGLEKLIARDDAILYPTHGSPIPAPRAFLREYLIHRRAREAQILAAVARGADTIPALVEKLYAGIDPALRAAAAGSVAAHLVKLEQEGRARREGGRWRQ